MVFSVLLVDFLCLLLSPRAPLHVLNLLGKVWVLELPPSHDRVRVSRFDCSRFEKRGGCRFSQNAFRFVQAHPRALRDVTHSAFGPQDLTHFK